MNSSVAPLRKATVATERADAILCAGLAPSSTISTSEAMFAVPDSMITTSTSGFASRAAADPLSTMAARASDVNVLVRADDDETTRLPVAQATAWHAAMPDGKATSASEIGRA